MTNYSEARCWSCNRKLFEANTKADIPPDAVTIPIKCRRCKAGNIVEIGRRAGVQTLTITNAEVYTTGQ